VGGRELLCLWLLWSQCRVHRRIMSLVEALGDVSQAQSCWDEPGGFAKGLVIAERFRICCYERGDTD
jgi:hypothetical protein